MGPRRTRDWIGFATESELWKVTLDGRTRKPLCSLPALGGTPERLTTLAEGELGHCWPEALPGTKAILFMTQSSEGYDVALQSAAGDAHEILIEVARFPLYLAPGYLVYLRGSDFSARTFDAGALRLGDTAVRLAERVRTSSMTGIADFCLGQDGTLVYATPDRPISDGSELFYHQEDKLMSVPITLNPPLSFGTPGVVYRGIDIDVLGRAYDVMLDGQRLLVIKEDPLVPDRRLEIRVVVNWIEELHARIEGRD